MAADGWGDLRRWPELLHTRAAVMVHVLQKMVVGIIRIRFKELWGGSIQQKSWMTVKDVEGRKKMRREIGKRMG